jgi:RecB family exonuclease
MSLFKSFDPHSKKAFTLSRTKIELFINCPRCFYLDRREGIGRPSIPGYTLNSAVDALLKKEFDIHRAKNRAHPLMKAYGLGLVPYAHEKIDIWRENFKGVQYYHEPTNFLVFGAVDDLWVDKKGTIHVVDYKATSTSADFDLESPWKQAYKRQMEIYQWLLRQNGFPISDTGYFVACNGRKDREAFDAKLEFKVEIVPYKGSDKWVEKAIKAAHKCLMAPKTPKSSVDCEYCNYVKAAGRNN